MTDELKRQVAAQGFARATAAQMRELLAGAFPTGWATYAESWNDLALDGHMADGGRYRRRRFACLQVGKDGVMRLPHQPHFQSLDYNRLNGGVERWFEPVADDIAEHALTGRLIDLCRKVFGGPEGGVPWHAEMHQFRIEARAGEAGRPTPEGAHRDGVDWVLVMLVARRNVAAGVTEIFDPSGQPLGSFTLMEPLDAVFINDHRVFHGVTAIEPVNPADPAYRDVLVVTFRGA